jgi:phosphoglycerol transferase MdoB-like AlkP superfamily enzyme
MSDWKAGARALLTWEKFDTILRRGLKVWFFYLLVLFFFRLFFIVWMHSYLGAATGPADVWAAIWRGTRLSCQTSGALTAVLLAPAFLLHYVSARAERIWWRIGLSAELLVLSVLYVASFPYYREFHSNFSQVMLNAVNDDMAALFWTLVQEFYLPLRLLGAVLLAVLLFKAAELFVLRWQGPDISPLAVRLPLGARLLMRAAAVGLAVLLGVLSVFGGSLSWQKEVNWENSGITKSHFLNEAILDSLQAVHRAYTLQTRQLACNGLDFSVEDVQQLAAWHAGMPAQSDNLDDYLQHIAAGPVAEKPSHVFVIVSESLANWPLLEKYRSVPIANGLRGLLARDDTDYCPAFLPNGSSTVSAVTGIVTDFADANLYLTTMPEAFAEPYPNAIAPQMKRLGYQTSFWYAGPATWERIGAFVKAQGFDHFYSRGDFGEVPGSVWGCEDEVLYEKVLDGLGDNQGFHVVLNASNHSPYDVDLEAKGFNKEAVRASLPPEDQNDEELLKELGHYWYADRELTRFIAAVREKYPDSLFLIVGDHADRYNIEKDPTLYERYGIPFIVSGPGIHKGVLRADAAGSQIDLMPTLFELIAPKGFRYEAVGTSLTQENPIGVNYGFFITRQAIGKADTLPLAAEPLEPGKEVPPIDQQAYMDQINAVRSISWWRAKYGPVLDEAVLEQKGR